VRDTETEKHHFSLVSTDDVVYNVSIRTLGVKTMSQILSLRVPERMVERLDRFARRQGNGMTRTKAGLLLLEEALLEADFAGIEYRDSPLGRQPYMKNSGLAVWEVVMVAKHYGLDAARMAQDYPYSVEAIQAVLNFYTAHQEEIDQAIEDNEMDFETMRRLLPSLRLHEVPKELTDTSGAK
jgi:uncharacterized protein (DUF433 family)